MIIHLNGMPGFCPWHCGRAWHRLARSTRDEQSHAEPDADQPADHAGHDQPAESLGLTYPILSDPDKETAKAYGVLNAANGLAQRWTFVIGKDGKIRHIDQAVQPSTHGATVATLLKTQGN